MKTVKEAVREAVHKGAVQAVLSPRTSAHRSDEGEIAAKVFDEVAPIIAHATNSEPWYASRVTWGALLAAVAGVLGILGYSFPAEMQGKIIDLIIALLPIVGGLTALYGRWVAKKPIGS